MSATCERCGQQCEGTSGYSREDGTLGPLCHEGPSPTCYELWPEETEPPLVIGVGPSDLEPLREAMRALGAHHD